MKTTEEPKTTTTTTTTTTRAPTQKEQFHETIFKCSFDAKNSCAVKFSGKRWLLNTVSDGFNNELDSYYSVELNSNEKSEMFLQDMVPRPRDGIACLSFRYKKFMESKYRNKCAKKILKILATLTNVFFSRNSRQV